MKSLLLIYSSVLLLCLCICLGSGCKQKKEEVAQDSQNAVQKAYDKTTGVLRNVVEGINNAVYK